MTLQFRKLGAALALLGLTAGPALAITGATPTTAFKAVGRGIQVTPDWVMTVQHYAIAPGQTYSNGFGSWTVAATYFVQDQPNFPENDFALMRLVPNGSSVPYMDVSSALVPAGSFAPVAVTMASGANSGPARGYAYNTVSESKYTVDPDDAGPLGPVVVNWLVSWNSSVYVENGDSGSALFAGQVHDTGLLLGVASDQEQDVNGVPTGSAYVQPAAYRSWVDSVMANDSADNQVVRWVNPVAVPEPAPWALALAGAAALLARRSCATRSRA